MERYLHMMPLAAAASNAASQTSVFVAIGVAAIGALATVTVGYLAFRAQRQQLKLALSGQFTDRFTQAIDQMGSKNKAVRIGGIFALERIARDSVGNEAAEYTLHSIAYTLATFVRQTQPVVGVPRSAYVERLKLRAPDVQAAMTVLCRSPLSDIRVNASNAELRDLRRADLRLDLSGADLRRASLSGARLDGVNLWECRLEGANLRGAHLRCAGLSDAYLGRFNPDDPNYKYGADLSGADLTDAYLDNVRGLSEAKIKKTTGLSGSVNRRPEVIGQR
jgi:Pentapeptide repeats (8 copies)